MENIDGVHLLFLLLIDEQFYLAVQIAFVLQGRLKVLARLLGQERIVSHRGFTHVPERTVQPRTVLAGHRIDTKGNLQRREPARIPLLAYIVLHLSPVDILVFAVGVHSHIVEHVGVFRQMTRCRAST